MKSAVTAAQAVERIPDGASLMFGGFMGVGNPDRLVTALMEAGRRDLTVIVNDTARDGGGVQRLIHDRRVRRMICSHIGLCKEAQRQMIAGEIEIELCPQGTFAERVRAGGVGLGGVITPTGVGTLAGEGRQTIEMEGKTYLVYPPIRADFACISAWRCDYAGNLTYTLSAQNFNPVMALAADTVIAEPDEIVPIGCIPPDEVRTPGALVDLILGREL